MKEIKAIIFDVGGVLLDLDFSGMLKRVAARSSVSLEEVKSQFLPERGEFGESDATPLARATAGRISADEVIDLVHSNIGFKGSKDELSETYFTLLPRRIELTLEIFREVRTRFQTGILSNTNAWGWRRVENLIPEIGLADKIFLSFNLGLVKPDPRIFKHVSRAFELEPQEIIFIDDSPEIIQSALSCGIKGIVFENPEGLKDSLNQALEGRLLL